MSAPEPPIDIEGWIEDLVQYYVRKAEALDDIASHYLLLRAQHNARRKARRAYVCLDCKNKKFHGSGSWQPAKAHHVEHGHRIAQNGKIKWP